MRQYFTYTNPYHGGAWHPVEYNVMKNIGELYDLIDKNFCVAQGSTMKDHRMLGYIDIPEDENGDTIVPYHPTGLCPAIRIKYRILRMFPHSLQTVEEAKEKVERWTGRTDITIEGENVVIPDVDPII